MQLGIGSYTFTWAVGVPGTERTAAPLTAEDLIARARDLGVSVVQVCDNIPLDGAPDSYLANLSARAESTGVSVEVGTRGTRPDQLQRFLRIAVSLGARLVRSMIVTSVAEAEEDIRAVLPEFEKRGVVIAIENYEKHGVRALADMIARIGSKSLGACLDTVNSLGALELPQEAIDALLPHTASLHVKDFDIVRADHRMGFSVVGTPAGKGRLNVPALLDAARNNGRDPNTILELWTPPAGSLEETVAREHQWAKESISFLRRYVQT
jgi:sugar phosphate isomerase/epimerase